MVRHKLACPPKKFPSALNWTFAAPFHFNAPKPPPAEPPSTRNIVQIVPGLLVRPSGDIFPQKSFKYSAWTGIGSQTSLKIYLWSQYSPRRNWVHIASTLPPPWLVSMPSRSLVIISFIYFILAKRLSRSPLEWARSVGQSMSRTSSLPRAEEGCG